MKNIKIKNADLDFLESIRSIADDASDYLVPNTKMIYYLSCTVFKRFSFLAVEDNIPVGFIFAMPNYSEEALWIHQIAVLKEYKNTGIGTVLLNKLDEIARRESIFNFLMCAIKVNNLPSKQFFQKHKFENIGLDSYISMDIFRKRL